MSELADHARALEEAAARLAETPADAPEAQALVEEITRLASAAAAALDRQVRAARGED